MIRKWKISAALNEAGKALDIYYTGVLIRFPPIVRSLPIVWRCAIRFYIFFFYAFFMYIEYMIVLLFDKFIKNANTPLSNWYVCHPPVIYAFRAESSSLGAHCWRRSSDF